MMLLFPCPLAYLVTFASRAPADTPKGDCGHVGCLSACGHKTTHERHHGTSSNDTVVTSRYSTVYYQTSPTKSDGVSESVQCVPHKNALGDNKSRMCPPLWLADAANMGLHPICNVERVSSTNDGQIKWFRDNHTAHCETHEIPWAPTHNTQYKLNKRSRCQQPRDEHNLHV